MVGIEGIYGKNGDKRLDLEHSMFFLETSGKSTIHPRFACCIESAAKHHPNTIIYLFMTSKTIDMQSMAHVLQHYKNVQIKHINVEQFLGGKIDIVQNFI